MTSNLLALFCIIQHLAAILSIGFIIFSIRAGLLNNKLIHIMLLGFQNDLDYANFVIELLVRSTM